MYRKLEEIQEVQRIGEAKYWEAKGHGQEVKCLDGVAYRVVTQRVAHLVVDLRATTLNQPPLAVVSLERPLRPPLSRP